ncbi:SprT family protein [Schleiferilactobacillus shenzhenensis]|uniref:SprT-like protein n=1 Tax=Schleiferilactobacillus shenzhenensis LY-73 TaxID=1231336 RepID=U4THA3_9LACO|nr:SprT family protein [Schleiferilactobacillus shenzhenensis]ERL64186.1 SprT-like protein [Schleiferilactobacillus shenzhenensis LY-73]
MAELPRTNAELTALVQSVSERTFHRAFVHQALYNSRLRTTGGRYRLRDHNIEINPRLLQYYGMSELLGVIKHELCHYHLHLLHGGYQHKDADFKQWLAASGGSRFAPPMPPKKEKTVNYLYVCPHCHAQYPRQRRIDTRRFVCGRCHNRLALVAVDVKMSQISA